MSGHSCGTIVCLAAVVLTSAPVSAEGPDDQRRLEFFETRIRPVLIEHCYECHSAASDPPQGNLRLDHRDGLLAGGDSGPAVAPGEPADSVLIQALRYDGYEMPPSGRLPEAVVRDFEKWVRDGAFDPRDEPPAAAAAETAAPETDHWAYRPPRRHDPPDVADAAWSADPIDRFVLARLEAAGLRPAPEADRATVIRRLTFDLTGLPPTPEEIDAYLADHRPDAYERLVDRLLARPEFGERWGRHWLDVARYAESVTLRGLVFGEAWRYRDYVIDAFDRDVPFDRFVKEQIAGDLLPAATPTDRERQIVATTYLVLGNTNLEEQDKSQLRMDVVDEQLDVIGKGLLAQTITCARCHDHKFDPIPTRDYYALAGILRNVKALEDANVSRWVEVPLPAAPEVETAVREHEAAVAELQARIVAAKAAAAGTSSATGVLAAKDVPGIVVDDTEAMKVGDWKDSTFTGAYIGAGYVHDLDAGKGRKSITFAPNLPASGEYEVWLAYAPGQNRAEGVPVTVFGAGGEKTILVDMKPRPPLGGRFVSLGRHRFEKDGQSFVLVANDGTRGHVTPDAVTFIPAEEVAAAEASVGAPQGSGGAPRGDAGDLAKLEAQLKKLRATAPRRPAAMSVLEREVIEDARVHLRGSVHRLGETVPRGFLRAATHGPTPTMPPDWSGRVELAGWVASPENPLTARVYVNRAWHWLFGAGIVRTVDNFGTTGEPPSHPELLDFLAVRFVEEGWSVKTLVRRIVLSRAYRQSANGDPRTIAADPENRLFGRADRRRLDAECLRDAILSVAGKLTDFSGGPTFPEGLSSDYGFTTAATYRSVYLPVFRNALPDIFEAFDFADPSTVTGRRNESTVPQQALFMTNNPFVIEQARHAAARLLAEADTTKDRITRAYRLTLGREPTAGERQAVETFLSGRPDGEASWALVFQALFASPEFRYLE